MGMSASAIMFYGILFNLDDMDEELREKFRNIDDDAFDEHGVEVSWYGYGDETSHCIHIRESYETSNGCRANEVDIEIMKKSLNGLQGIESTLLEWDERIKNFCLAHGFPFENKPKWYFASRFDC